MAQKKTPSLTQKTTKKKQPLTAEVELQLRQEELQLINRELAHSQVELEAAYRQYTDLYDFAPVGYFTLMRNGVIHQVNLAGSNLLGVNHNAATKLRLAAFVSSESRPAFDIFFEKLLSAEGKETCELVLEKRGHGLLWARLEATCFEGGNVCRAMLTDITERKRLEKILQESENRFRTLLQDVSTIAVQGYAIDGTTQYWNAASEQLYGYSTQEALGQSLLDLIIPSEMRSDVWHAIQQMGETGQPIPAAELSLMRKDGSHVDVYSSHAIVSVPGRTPELFCLDVDLTERKRAEKALQESESRYRELIELAVDGILVGSPEGIIIGANTYMLHLTGRTLNNLVGKHVNELFNSDELKSTPLRFDLLQKGETVTNERQLVRPDGNVVPIEMHTKIMPDGTYQSIYRDITERKQAEELLKESEWRTRIVSELTTDYIFVVDVDPSGILKLRWASDNLPRITGRTINDAATPDLWKSIIHPDDRNRFFDFVSQIRSTAEAGELECRSLYKHGGERWVHIFARPQIDEGNQVTTIVGAVQDITERKQADEQLQESEKRFRNLVETTSDWIWEIDANGFYTYASPRISDILGFESTEIIGKKPEDFMPPEEAQRVQGILIPIFASRSQFSNLENKNLHKDGHVIFLETSGVPIVDNDGVFCGYRGIDRDITERKQAQEALKKSEAHYHDLVETSQDLIWQCDSEGRYTYLNPAWEQVFGYKTKEMLGKKFADFQTPQMAARDQKEFARLMRGNTIKGFETTHIGRSGNEIHLVFNAKSIVDENGKVIGTHGTAYDITERKKAEQALKKSESLYRKMNENSPLGMHFYKLNNNDQLIFVGANPAADKLLGVDNSQFIGKTIEEAFPPLIKTEVPERYRDTAAKGVPWSTEQIIYDDTQITGAFDVRAFQTTPGNMVAIFADITERKLAEVELQHTKVGLETANRDLQTALALQQQLAHTDTLTGINNRRHLYELAEHEFEIAARYQQPLSVIMFDIDHFKQVNDTFGHTIGDQILQRVTQVARAELRSADVIGRYGGEEFVVILPMTNAKKAYPLAERIRMGVAAMHVPTEKGDAAVTLSIGIVEITHGAQNQSIEVMIRNADEAMYAAKQAGRNRTEIR